MKKEKFKQPKPASLKSRRGFRVYLTDEDVRELENATRALSILETEFVEADGYDEEQRTQLWLRVIRPQVETLRQRSRSISERFSEAQKAWAALSRDIA